MNTEDVGNLIAKVPQGLSPDEFLMALANLVETTTREACAREIEVEVEDFRFHEEDAELDWGPKEITDANGFTAISVCRILC